MKFLALSLVLAICGVFCPAITQAKEPELNLVSFNIRNGTGGDGDNHWKFRKEYVSETIRGFGADLIGLQEATHFQLEKISTDVPEFASIGTGSNGGKKGQYTAIIYLKQRFELQDGGSFWLSDTPSKPSRHWGNHHLRNCTWAILRDKQSKATFCLYNTHLDDGSQASREKSVEAIVQHSQKHAKGLPVIFMGDFNVGEDSPAITFLTQQTKLSGEAPIKFVDTFRALHTSTEGLGTYHGFKGKTQGARIDYIFVTKQFRTLAASIDRSNKEGRYPSDHFPVTATVRLTQSK